MSEEVVAVLDRKATEWWHEKLSATNAWGTEREGILAAMAHAVPIGTDGHTVAIRHRGSLSMSLLHMMNSFLDEVADRLNETKAPEMSDNLKEEVGHASSLMRSLGFSGGLARSPYLWWKRYCEPIQVEAVQLGEEKKVEKS